MAHFPINLPIPRGVESGLRLGRDVRAGYVRGWGLQYGDLAAQIARDPEYVRSYDLARSRSIVREERLKNLYLLIRFYLPALNPGHIIEFGTFKGGSALFMASLCKTYLPGTEVWGLDTFAGMPKTDKGVDAHNENDFNSCDLDELERFRERQKLDNLHLVKGTFEQTTPGVLEACGSVRMAHIDCDIYSSCRYAFETCRGHMVPGGYYVFDDATESSCIGATEVVEDIVIRKAGLTSEQISPHFVFRETLG